MDDEQIQKFLEENKKCYDRFTFDEVIRFLLSAGFNNEEAKDLILCNCELSAITFEDRIFNNYYLRIITQEFLSPDLQELIWETLRKEHINPN